MSGVKRVLVVEDEPLLLLDLVDALSDHGIEAVAFTSSRNAQLAFSDTSIDALITDIELPGGLSGLELARLFASQRPGLPVVIASGGVLPTPSELPAGAVFVAKPYRFSQILAALQNGAAAKMAASGPASIAAAA
jgi:DNA-binding NtrC family response regulator